MPSIERVFRNDCQDHTYPRQAVRKRKWQFQALNFSVVIHDRSRPGKSDRQPRVAEISLPAAVPVKALKICTVSTVTFSDIWPDFELEHDSHLLHCSYMYSVRSPKSPSHPNKLPADCLPKWHNPFLVQAFYFVCQMRYLPTFYWRCQPLRLTVSPDSLPLFGIPLSESCQAGLLQLQKLVCTVLAVRNRPGLGGIEEQDEYLNRLLSDKSKPSLPDAITNPTLALHDIVSVGLDIEYFERCFVASQLRCLSSGFKAAPEEIPPTRTELHRIRRGFCGIFSFSATFPVLLHLGLPV